MVNSNFTAFMEQNNDQNTDHQNNNDKTNESVEEMPPELENLTEQVDFHD